MKMKRTTIRPLVFAILIVAELSFSPARMNAQENVGARFGARDPKTCKDRKQPAKGAPSPEQVREYFTCGEEHSELYYLYLIEDVKNLEVGAPRKYNHIYDNFSEIDPQYPVYPIRGSFKEYNCSRLGAGNAGKNCMVYNEQNATGACWKTSFGDWKCKMMDANAMSSPQSNMPPPK